MHKVILSLFFCLLFSHFSIAEQASPSQQDSVKDIITFHPPKEWMLADEKILPPHVKVLVVGKSPTNFPPSLNLSYEPYRGTLQQYLKTVKNMNSSQGYHWKDLGTIKTKAGVASLSHVDTKTQWGDVRLMHVILIRSGYVYILTASALKEEFSLFYKDFFKAMQSLEISSQTK